MLGSKKKELDVFEMIVALGDYNFIITVNGGLRLNACKTSQPQFFSPSDFDFSLKSKYNS